LTKESSSYEPAYHRQRDPSGGKNQHPRYRGLEGSANGCKYHLPAPQSSNLVKRDYQNHQSRHPARHNLLQAKGVYPDTKTLIQKCGFENPPV